jgi:hypothetical protein
MNILQLRQSMQENKTFPVDVQLGSNEKFSCILQILPRNERGLTAHSNQLHSHRSKLVVHCKCYFTLGGE